MISRPRNRGGLAMLALGLGLGGWSLVGPIAPARGAGGVWEDLGFGGFQDGMGGYGGAFGYGVYPGTIGFGPGGMGFGMPGWGNLQAAAAFNPARFDFDDAPGYRGPRYPGPGYAGGHGYGVPYYGPAAGAYAPLSAFNAPAYPVGPAFPPAPVMIVPPQNPGRSAAYVTPGASVPAAHGRFLGIDEEPAVDASGRRGMRVAKVYPGTAAERSGLKPGDVVRSINGYRTEARGNLAWIIAYSAADNVLKMNVLTAGDGKEHTITARIP